MNFGMLELIVRAAVLLSAAWIASLALRRAPAALGSAVWTVAFAGLLLLPALNRATPAWRVAVSPALSAAIPDPVTHDSPAARATPVALAAADTSVAPTPVTGVIKSPTLATGPSVSIKAAALMLWMLVTAFLIGRVALSHRQAHRLLDTAAEPVSEDWRRLVDETRARLRISRAVGVHLTDAVTLPAVIGVWRPTLLLPADADEWNDDMRRVVLLHELAHVARWDAMRQLVERTVCAVYWCVPLAWLAARRSSALREQACDDVVLRAGVEAPAYAARLIDLARQATGVPMAALSMAQPSQMSSRVRRILNPAIHRGVLSLPAALAFVIAAGAVVTAASTMVLVDREAVPLTSAVASPPQAAAPTVLCGDNVKSSSSSIHEDNGSRQWTVKVTADDCRVDFRVDGKIEFNDDFTDVGTLSANGTLTLDVTEGGVRHQLDVRSRNGNLERTWKVNGVERPYDAEARAWFGSFLIALDRRTAIGVDQRLPKLLKQGGVDAVLAETAMMSPNYARGEYFKKLAATVRLAPKDGAMDTLRIAQGPKDVARMLDQAATSKTDDYYASELLKNLAGTGHDDPAVHRAVMALIGNMKSDFYISESMSFAIGSAPATSSDIDLFLQLIPRIKSDFYKTEVFRKIQRAGVLSPAQRAALAPTVLGMHENFYIAEFIKMLAGTGDLTAKERSAVIDASHRLTEDHYKGEVLKTLTSEPSLTEGELLQLIDSARTMRSDFYKAEALKSVARYPSATDRVRSAVVDAAAGMSSFYAGEVLRAARVR